MQNLSPSRFSYKEVISGLSLKPGVFSLIIQSRHFSGWSLSKGLLQMDLYKIL